MTSDQYVIFLYGDIVQESKTEKWLAIQNLLLKKCSLFAPNVQIIGTTTPGLLLAVVVAPRGPSDGENRKSIEGFHKKNSRIPGAELLAKA